MVPTTPVGAPIRAALRVTTAAEPAARAAQVVTTAAEPAARAAEEAAIRAGAAVIELGAGTRLAGGRYLLERPLGAGGMASVWLARDSRLSRPVAVKILADALIGDPGYLERFRREARLAAGLSHPNLVAVYDYAAEDERPYLVMEFIAGTTLADRIRRGETAELDAALVARQLLAALEHIHDAGIVHRDVKPSNVLLDSERPETSARLTDFGIARPVDATALTATGEVMGTLRYLAPELLRGERATPASDLYGCGVLLRQLIADERSPPRLIELVDALTADDPELRPASAREALAALNRRDLRGAKPQTGPPPENTGPTAIAPRAGSILRTGATRRVASPTSGPAPSASRASRAGVAALAVVIIVVALVLGRSGGHGGRTSTPPSRTPSASAGAASPAPPGAPLGGQLDALTRTVTSLARH